MNAIGPLHALFWAPFAIRVLVELPKWAPAPRADGPAAPNASLLVASHIVGLFVLYFGVGYALPNGFFGGPILAGIGAALILGGTALSSWTLVVFRSWKLRAEIGADHELCTVGPFRLVRHPIYTAMDLMALGTLLWAPHPIVGLGAVGIVIAGDLRARAEEKLLVGVFGGRYTAYMASTRRLIPGVY
jgi:protein-S-isoprenylcysteine O-methyltransferase Ste14